MSEFERTDRGEPKSFLGMNIERHRETKTRTINQNDYTEKILEKFGFRDAYPVDTPMVTRQVSNREQRKREKEFDSNNSDKSVSLINVPYRETVGSLLYLAGSTRPDISYAVNVLSRYQMNPTENELKLVERVFQYLKGTVAMGLVYQGRRDDMVAYSDSNFADCEGSKSTCGYIIRLFGDTVAWKTNKQNFVALSTCEAEYIAMSQCCQEIVSIDLSISRLLGRSILPAKLKCDNQAAIHCASTNGGNKLRHVTEKHYHYVRECRNLNRVDIKWVLSENQLADILTKPLAFLLHNKLTKKILNIDCE